MATFVCTWVNSVVERPSVQVTIQRKGILIPVFP